MQDNGLVCWKCGASIGDEPLPLSRLAECRMCALYDTRVAKACRETVAEEVKDKERANFCGYFQPRQNALVASPGKAADRQLNDARAALDALFGGAPENKPDNPLDDLFRKN